MFVPIKQTNYITVDESLTVPTRQNFGGAVEGFLLCGKENKELQKMKQQDPIIRCPHCAKCCSILDECDDGVNMVLHKTSPSKKPGTVRVLVKRRCAHSNCKQDFYVEINFSLDKLRQAE